jgi:hypothetical protein
MASEVLRETEEEGEKDGRRRRRGRSERGTAAEARKDLSRGEKEAGLTLR